MSPSTARSEVDVAGAARRLEGLVRRTPLVPFELSRPPGAPPLELHLKLECLQETGSFKARGASNQVALLSVSERSAGVVTTSSGNHGKAVAWAAARAGVRATIVMPADAYPNKIQACRELGAEVLLGRDRAEAEELCRKRVALGATLVHPYDSARTIEGAGTVGLEIAEDLPELDLLLVPVGGGGLLAGCTLAVRGRLGPTPALVGVEPEGAQTLGPALERGEPVPLRRIATLVQGLCPPSLGRLPLSICRSGGVRALSLSDEEILAAQRELVRRGGWTVEPAGAAGVAAVMSGKLPELLLALRRPDRALRVAAVVSGGNPDPAQLASIR